MSFFQKAKAALANLVNKVGTNPLAKGGLDSIVSKEPPKARKRKLKYFWVSTQPTVIKGVLRQISATFNVGRNKEKRAVGKGWFRPDSLYGRSTPKRNTLDRRVMLDGRRARQVAV